MRLPINGDDSSDIDKEKAIDMIRYAVDIPGNFHFFN